MLYLGRSLDGERPLVALKVIRPDYARDMNFVAMFLDEAKLTSRLSHPSIVRIYEQASDDGKLFIAMELLFGQSLATVWEASQKRGPALLPEVVAYIGARVAEGLHHAHELADDSGVPQEVVHRDINPSNVFVTYGGHVKIIDFGLAKAVDRITSTQAGVVKGKLAYMAPEQIAGPGVDRRTDIFALGTTIWELSVGRRLFKADNDVETMKNVREALVPDPRSIVRGYPPALADILLRALAKDPAARHPTAAALGKDLDSYVMAGGRIINPATLLDLMTNLFPGERDRDASWFEHAELPIRTVPLAPLQLPSQDLVSEGSAAGAVGASVEEAQPPVTAPVEPPRATERLAALEAPAATQATEASAERAAEVVAETKPEPTVMDLVDPTATPVEPSTGGLPAGLPSGPLGLLSQGEIAMFAALAILVLVAIMTAVLTRGG